MRDSILVHDGEFVVISTEKLANFNSEFVKHTKQCFDEYKDLFEVDVLPKLSFVLFDDLENYREDYRSRLQREPPSYSRGNFSINTAYISVDRPIIWGTDYFYKERASGAHEAFHIFYRDLVYREDDNRIVWFDEGLAQFFSREKDFMDEERFKKYYLNFKKNYKPITNLNERIQGNTQIPDDKIFSRKGVISGYPLSYFAIRYLAETRGIDYLKEVMRDNRKILELGENIIEEFTSFYDEKFVTRDDEER